MSRDKHRWGVVFDMDGVLIDSVARAYEMRSRLLAARNVDLDDVPDVHGDRHRGSSLRDLLAAVRQYTGVVIDEEAFAAEALAEMPEAFREVQPDDGLLALLQELKRQEVPCAIASGGRSEIVQVKLAALGIQDYFQQVVTGHDVTRHKPDPEAYRLTAQRLGLKPEQCVVIEDSVAGAAAGVAAGCVVVGFTGFNTRKRPLEGTRLMVDNWSDLPYELLQTLPTNRRI